MAVIGGVRLQGDVRFPPKLKQAGMFRSRSLSHVAGAGSREVFVKAASLPSWERVAHVSGDWDQP